MLDYGEEDDGGAEGAAVGQTKPISNEPTYNTGGKSENEQVIAAGTTGSASVTASLGTEE